MSSGGCSLMFSYFSGCYCSTACNFACCTASCGWCCYWCWTCWKCQTVMIVWCRIYCFKRRFVNHWGWRFFQLFEKRGKNAENWSFKVWFVSKPENIEFFTLGGSLGRIRNIARVVDNFSGINIQRRCRWDDFVEIFILQGNNQNFNLVI